MWVAKMNLVGGNLAMSGLHHSAKPPEFGDVREEFRGPWVFAGRSAGGCGKFSLRQVRGPRFWRWRGRNGGRHSSQLGLLAIALKMEVSKAEQQHHFVLVHGAQEGAWCWIKTMALLEQAGHRATAVDLVSAGDSTVSADDVKSFDHYNQPLYEVLDSLAPHHKVILVGHSMGGTSVARASERYPHKIHATVYVAAAMLTSGKSVMDEQVQTSGSGGAQFNFGNGEHNPPTSCWLPVEVFTKVCWNCCSSEDIELASKRLKPFPIMFDDATTFTNEGYYSVPRVYIRCSLDQAMPPHRQDHYISQNPPTAVLHLETDHGPFFSAAGELHQHLLSVAAAHANTSPKQSPPMSLEFPSS